RESKISQYHFIRLFKSIFKISPYQYIIKKRLELAKVLLACGTGIPDASYQTGFSSPANFSKAFKSQFGTSPKNFLK
ncbi:MAG TPA: helix-turn-helix domain-containing protein, partial [Flavobacterium sp.]|nr:helix-turn-helix domain-containing protein [Flavobacterium sp.]